MLRIALALSAFAFPTFAETESTVPEADTPPALRADKGYVMNVETAIFDGTPAEVRAALQSEEGSVLAFVAPTDAIPGIAELTPLVDMFPTEGAVRRVRLTNDEYVVERVIRNDAEGFEYQIWNFTSSEARFIDHIHGRFAYEAIDGGKTEVTWTYAIAPRVFFARPFIRSFIENDFEPFMESGLTGAMQHFNARAN